MPKVVDREQRRAEIGVLVLQAIAKFGINKATVRTIAREGGFTSGLLSHYFTNKGDMVDFAFGAVADAVFERIALRTAEANTPLAKLRIAIEEFLPKDNTSVEAVIPISFWGQAIHDESLQPHFTERYKLWREYLRGPLLEAEQAGDLRPEVVIEDEINLLIAVADGLVVSWTLDPSRFDRAAKVRLTDNIINGLQCKLWLESTGTFAVAP